jgi:mannose-6-phosphate isomerase-like protein (cupin superfamily)
MPIIEGAGRFVAPEGVAHYDEHLRVADLSVGTYCLPVGAVDDQTPHTEDEIYVVVAGRAVFVDLGGPTEVRAGDTIFVAAGDEHRFTDVTEDLTLVVVFAPAEDSRAGVSVA